jgi:cytochrome c-type biogenesis protein CcmH
MVFWILAALIGLLAAVFTAWPLLAERAAIRNYGFAIIVMIPIAALVMYQVVGTPAGIGVTGSPGQASQAAHPGGDAGMGMDAMVANLESRMQQNPADLDGWMLLGRTYKAMQRYREAETALVRAIQLAPNNPTVMVELAEAQMFTSGSATVSPEVRGLLEQALEMQPDQQKGLWLLGIAAAQDGDNDRALELWSRLAEQLEPGSPILVSLEQQMAQLGDRPAVEPTGMAQPTVSTPPRSMSGVEPEPELEEDEAPAGEHWSGLRVDVNVASELGDLPPGAALFVILRNPAIPGPPLGVARMSAPTFPAIAFVSDANSMMEGMPISGVPEVEVLARLSMSGSPVAGPNDLESDTLRVELDSTSKVELTLAPR